MIVTVTSHKGGVGKSQTAIHLAAVFVEEFGQGSTVLVDGDPNATVLEWAERGREHGFELPFPVVDPMESSGGEEHAIYDTQGRLRGDDLEAAAEGSDLLVIPTTPEAESINALGLLVQDIRELGTEVPYKVLLTMVPWWNRRGSQARKGLEQAEVPMFSGWIRRREAFPEAGAYGCLVQQTRKRNARECWEEYVRVGKEVIAHA